jgi:hypothetical protein
VKEEEVQEFKDAFFNSFLTKEEELAKFKPNDEKEVDDEDDEACSEEL